MRQFEPPDLKLPASVAPKGKSPQVKAFMNQLRSTIATHGWAVQAVAPTEATPEAERFTYVYTIGLLERGCMAELLITGLPVETAASLVNEIAAEMTSGPGIPPSTWELTSGHRLVCVFFVPRPESLVSVGVARSYYETPALPMAQYVWPDVNHNYPWDKGWSGQVRQPVPGRERI